MLLHCLIPLSLRSVRLISKCSVTTLTVKLFISLLQTVITIKVLNSLLLCFTILSNVSHSFIILNAIWFLCINTELFDVRLTDWLTENDINQYSVNTIPVRSFWPRVFLLWGLSLFWPMGYCLHYSPGEPLAGWPSYWLRPARGAYLLQYLRFGEFPVNTWFIHNLSRLRGALFYFYPFSFLIRCWF